MNLRPQQAIDDRRVASCYATENIVHGGRPREGRALSPVDVELPKAMEQVPATTLPHLGRNHVVRPLESATRAEATVEDNLRLARGEEKVAEKAGEAEKSETLTTYSVHDRTGVHSRLPSGSMHPLDHARLAFLKEGKDRATRKEEMSSPFLFRWPISSPPR